MSAEQLDLMLSAPHDAPTERSVGGLQSCTACGKPTLRVTADGVAMHSTCETRHTWATASSTSWAAGKAAKRGPTSRVTTEILELLRSASQEGMTDDELQQAMPNDPPGSVSKRRVELVRAGLVSPTGDTRPTRWGRQAQVWRLRATAPETGEVSGAVTAFEPMTPADETGTAEDTPTGYPAAAFDRRGR